jgi:radical SAM superfamily enzyme with C-terminal helix-hairpin-helix motif
MSDKLEVTWADLFMFQRVAERANISYTDAIKLKEKQMEEESVTSYEEKVILQELAKPFPQKYIHNNPTGFGEYIQHSVIRQRLLSVLGPYEQRVIQVFKEEMTDKQGKTKTVTTGVVLEMTFNIGGRDVSVQEVGDVEQPFNWKTEGARMKDAVSDAVKRCAMAIGCGLHLWARHDGKSEYFLDQQLSKELEGDGTE